MKAGMDIWCEVNYKSDALCQSVEEESAGQGALSGSAKRKEQVERVLQKGRAKRHGEGFQLKGRGGCSYQLLHLVSFAFHSLKRWRRWACACAPDSPRSAPVGYTEGAVTGLLNRRLEVPGLRFGLLLLPLRIYNSTTLQSGAEQLVGIADQDG
ncbi:MAG: hypothetical protein FRX49_08872 [Trebouxia sp. A1-2]|nr:MAG: hypothetical protein FRX49_08872 [Trebouxia sp. A1-2]